MGQVALWEKDALCSGKHGAEKRPPKAVQTPTAGCHPPPHSPSQPQPDLLSSEAPKAPAHQTPAQPLPAPRRSPRGKQVEGAKEAWESLRTDSVTLKCVGSAGLAASTVGDAQGHNVERVVSLGDGQLAGELLGLRGILARLLGVFRRTMLAANTKQEPPTLRFPEDSGLGGRAMARGAGLCRRALALSPSSTRGSSCYFE